MEDSHVTSSGNNPATPSFKHCCGVRVTTRQSSSGSKGRLRVYVSLGHLRPRRRSGRFLDDAMSSAPACGLGATILAQKSNFDEVAKEQFAADRSPVPTRKVQVICMQSVCNLQ